MLSSQYRTIIRLLPVILCIIGCGRSSEQIVITNNGWPDGTSISVLDETGIANRTTLYGSHVSVNFTQRDRIRIRAASLSHVTMISDTIPVTGGKILYTLPPPVPRRRIGSWQLGFDFRTAVTDSSYLRVLSMNDSRTLTTISPKLLHNPGLNHIIQGAHSRGIEITARIALTARRTAQENEEFVRACADSAEVYGIDGILVEPDSATIIAEDFAERMQRMAGVLHSRGMLLALRVCATLK